LYDTHDIQPLSTNLHSDFLNCKSKSKSKSNEPESPRIKALTQENYRYVPLEVDVYFNPATLEQDFFWISRLKDNLSRNTPAIQKVCEHYTEKLVYISKLNNLRQKYDKIQDNLAIDFGKIDNYLHETNTISPYLRQKLKITLTLGLIIPHLRNKHKKTIEKMTESRTNLFYYYYFIKNTFLPELKETQKLLTDYKSTIGVP